jgi:eukaryotic-like serine/threonine-protein kinase
MSKFGQYQLFDRIAIGGMAEIFRGRAAGEEGFEKQVAIKRILPAYARDGRFISMLVTEARIHSALTHRNIVQIHDLGVSDDGEYFIVLEYVDGHDLGALLSRLGERRARGSTPHQLSDAVALYVAIELGEGIHFAHELTGTDGQPVGLIHRDISPSNVLVSYAGEVKLSDFGLAKRRTDHSVVGSLKGKLAYMSPEQARRAPIDRRSDLFALGAVLFEMLTGHPLREISDDVAGWQQVASGLIPPLRGVRPDLPVALERLLQKALEPDPRDRHADVRAFVNEARAALDELPRSRMGEAGELQALLKALLPPGTARPERPASRVIRLLSEIVSTDTVNALGSDETVVARDLVSHEPGDSSSNITAITPTPEPPAKPGAPTPPPPLIPAALEWPAPLSGPPAIGAIPPPVPADAQAPAPIGIPMPQHTLPGPAIAPAIPGLGKRPPVRASGSGESLPSVAGLIDRPGAPARNEPVGRTADERIIAAWPSLLGPPASAPGQAPGDLATPLIVPGDPAAGLTPPLGGAGGANRPTSPPPMPFLPAPSAPGLIPPAPALAVGPQPPPLTQSTAEYPPPAPPPPIFYSPPPPPPLGRPSDRLPAVHAAQPPPRRLPVTLFLLLLGFAGGATYVHKKVIPLEVLAVWTRPARLHIRTEPRGAEVFLDQQRLSALTPTYTEVTRDRRAHVVEIRREGFTPETQSVRFDRTVALEISVKLRPTPPTPPPRAPLPETTTPAPPAATTTPTQSAAPSEAKPKSRGRGKNKNKRPRRGSGSAGQRAPK